MGMDTRKPAAEPPHDRVSELPAARAPRALGIVIAVGALGSRGRARSPLVRAFVYGEEIPNAPTLPFGRSRKLS